MGFWDANSGVDGVKVATEGMLPRYVCMIVPVIKYVVGTGGAVRYSVRSQYEGGGLI